MPDRLRQPAQAVVGVGHGGRIRVLLLGKAVQVVVRVGNGLRFAVFLGQRAFRAGTSDWRQGPDETLRTAAPVRPSLRGTKGLWGACGCPLFIPRRFDRSMATERAKRSRTLQTPNPSPAAP